MPYRVLSCLDANQLTADLALKHCASSRSYVGAVQGPRQPNLLYACT